MKKARIIWAIWLLLALAYGLLSEDPFALTVFPFSVILPLLMAWLTRRAARDLTAQLSGVKSEEKGSTAAAHLTVSHPGLFPLERVMVTLSGENLLTGATFRKRLRMSFPGRKTVTEELELSEEYCGKVRITLVKAEIKDPFGLFKFEKVFGDRIQVLWRPRSFPVATEILYGESMNLDSEEYSMRKAGFDPSETFAIREYMPGDSPRQIHWKLSEKMGDLMVRDYGLPIQNTILLLLETGYQPGTQAPEPSRLDGLMEGFVSLSQELAARGIGHSIAWQNHEDHSFSIYEIGDAEELISLLPELLGAAAGEDPVSVLGHYLEGREQCEFAHTVIFAPCEETEADLIADRCLVTEILCEEAGAGTYQSGAVKIVSAGPEGMAEAMAFLEI